MNEPMVFNDLQSFNYDQTSVSVDAGPQKAQKSSAATKKILKSNAQSTDNNEMIRPK